MIYNNRKQHDDVYNVYYEVNRDLTTDLTVGKKHLHEDNTSDVSYVLKFIYVDNNYLLHF